MSARPDCSLLHISRRPWNDWRLLAGSEYALTNGYSIVTLDADFHSLIATAAIAGPSVIRLRVQRVKPLTCCCLALIAGPSVIRLRVQRLKASDAARLVRAVLDRVGHELGSGCFITVTKESVRIRRLPIQRRG